MKRTRTAVLGALTIATIGGAFAHVAPAQAGNGHPTQCIVPNIFAVVVEGGDTPQCADLEGLCIYAQDVGPSRAVHPQGGAIINPGDNCTSFPSECVISVLPPLDPGPSRTVHAAAPARVLPSAGYRPGETFPITNPSLCFDDDMPTAGLDLVPLVIAAFAALGAGAVLFDVRSRLVRTAR